jgi:hypothetical protein
MLGAHVHGKTCTSSWVLLFFAVPLSLASTNLDASCRQLSVSHFGARIDRLAAIATHLLLHRFKAVPVFKIQL